jgi:hypothetical protein
MTAQAVSVSSGLGRRLRRIRAAHAWVRRKSAVIALVCVCDFGFFAQLPIHTVASHIQWQAIVPSFCGTVDGRLLVAHLAPLLRQLCARMGDSKEVVRTQTTQAMFRLLSPPTGSLTDRVPGGPWYFFFGGSLGRQNGGKQQTSC